MNKPTLPTFDAVTSVHALRHLVDCARFVDVAVALSLASPETLDALITDYVGNWHDMGDGTVEVPIHAYLGLKIDDYVAWVQDPSRLSEIVERYRNELDSGVDP